MRVVIANFSDPTTIQDNFRGYWRKHVMPPARPPVPLFDQRHDWGFHIYALGVYLLNRGLAQKVEFWDYSRERTTQYHSNGILRVMLANLDDLQAYVEVYGYPDLFVNHGRNGQPVLDLFEGKCFRVHVPALRYGRDRKGNVGAECYLVDSEQYIDARSMLYIPVVNTPVVCPAPGEKLRDFVYLAENRTHKRHDILLNAVRGTALTGHLHPVNASTLDLTKTRVTTSSWNEVDVVELLRTSRMAVYPADYDSNAASMWECVAAGLPIVINENIEGGKHLVVPGVTGELASERNFLQVMRHVLRELDAYRPRQHFETHWDTLRVLESYVSFFVRMGWSSARTARGSSESH